MINNEQIRIQEIKEKKDIPYDLLLLADPFRESVNDYVERGRVYGAFKEGQVVGVYILIKTRPFTMELINIAVDEAFQGLGIGKLMLKNSIEKAREEGAKTLEVGTGNSSVSQLALYQKCGFRIKGIEIDYFKKHYPEEIIENGIACLDMIRLAIDFD